ncbi:MAG: hypothetical protein IT254_12325 [Chitinophagaceae bacterium]|nr:hypothetical protein [Bacteroidota bacterium]MCC6259101.1 hypothetical protein [Chitinophagaceae bacterium]MCW5918095.1 hypothetical protein [Ferruginibacter sp.]
MIKKIVPLLPALSLKDTEIFYRNKLRYQTTNFGHYLVVQKESVEFHFFLWDDPLNFIPGSLLIFEDNVEDLYTRFSTYDVVYPRGVIKKNIWGKNEFQVKDNNGNIIRFSGI